MGELPAAGQPPSLGTGVNVNLPALSKASEQIRGVQDALKGLKDSLRDIGSNSYMLTQGINSMFDKMAASAKNASSAVSGVAGAVGGMGSPRPTTGGGGSTTSSGGGSAAWVSTATASAGAAQAAAGGSGGGGGGSVPPGGIDLTGAIRGENSGDWKKDIAMFPLRFIRDQIQTNRQTALTASAAMGPQAFASGVSPGQMMSLLSRIPGGVQGTTSDILSLFSNAPSFGARYNWGNGANGPRTTGFLESVRQGQIINPGMPVAAIAGTIGGQAANVGAQQQAQFMTGGAMGMIKPGGGQKSLSEWADGILKWFEGLRGGSDRGKAFDYGQLLAQNFPGSNIDAWFEATGVSHDMREYWWSYALAKVNTGGAANQAKFSIGQDVRTLPQSVQQSPLWQRLQATTAMSANQLKLGGTMAGAYANKEQANRWFNDAFGNLINTMVPGAVSTGKLGFAQFMPDTMEQVFMTMLERSGGFGSLLGAMLGYGGSGGGPSTGIMGEAPAGSNMIVDLPGSWFDIAFGDTPGDTAIGDYTTTGGTSTAGLHPDMRRKVDAMMKANPNIKVNSGLRDNRMQQTLKKKGVGKVSGKPSAHTRGMAADLGPSSQYPWIMANAGKFGLKSGAKAGEPWHVGMGDIGGDIGDDFEFSQISDVMKMFASIISGGNDPATIMGGVSGLTSGFFDLLLGLITGGATDPTKLAFMPSVYDTLMAGTSVTLGGQHGINGGGGGNVPLPTGGGAGTQEAGIAAATALFNAGFKKRSDLETITAISWRESKWNPAARNPNTADRGLMQINWKAHRATLRSMGLLPPDDPPSLMNIQTNANVAYKLWADGGADYDSFQQLWGFSESSPYVDPPGSPGWDKNGDPLARTSGSNAAAVVAAANIPGLGDVEANYDYMSQRASAVNNHSMVFNNTFQIGGNAGQGGVDVRRTATLIADHLEDEMNRRQSRAN